MNTIVGGNRHLADGAHGDCGALGGCTSAGDDFVFGEQGADYLSGGGGDDPLLSGGTGTFDELHGQAGVDFLNGGDGTEDYCDSGPPPGDGGDSAGCENGPG